MTLRKAIAGTILLMTAGAGAVAAAQGTTDAVVASEQRVGDFAWFDAYATYVLTPNELKDYKLVRSAQDKQAVIEDFWKRRDPSPETTRNEYREAFYARMDYANKRFGQGVKGYKTSRGLIYVLLGPPNEYRYLNSFRTGWPVELWTYWSTDSRRLPAQYQIAFDLTPGRGGILFTRFPGQTGFERLLSRSPGALGGYLPPELVAAVQDLSRKAIRGSEPVSS